MSDHLIYFHRNPQTNKVFYIGMGNQKRPYTTNDRSLFWKKYVKKYGAPIIEIKENNLSVEEAYRKERCYINIFGRRRLDSNGTLLNLARGGLGSLGFRHSEATKEILRQKKLGKPSPLKGTKTGKPSYNRGKKASDAIRLAMSIARQGRVIKEETRKKLSIASSKRTHSDETKKKMSDWHKGKVVSSETLKRMSEAQKGKVIPEEVRMKLRGRKGVLSANYGKKISELWGHKVSATHKERGLHKGGNNVRARRVIDNNTGKTYVCIKDAAEDLGMSHDSLMNMLRGDRVNKTNISYLNPFPCHL